MTVPPALPASIHQLEHLHAPTVTMGSFSPRQLRDLARTAKPESTLRTQTLLTSHVRTVPQAQFRRRDRVHAALALRGNTAPRAPVLTAMLESSPVVTRRRNARIVLVAGIHQQD